MTDGDALRARLTMAEVAELAGVARPVVTNWRRRHADFPEPVAGHGQRQLFDGDQVVDWLVATGRGERDRLAPDLRLYALAGLASGGLVTARDDARQPPLPPHDLVAGLTALVCLRYLDDEPLHAPEQRSWAQVARLRERAAEADPDDALLRREVTALRADCGWLAGAVDELVEAAWSCARAYERVLALRGRFGADALLADAFAPAAAALVAGLSGVREHADRYGAVCVADPAAGCGDLLLPVLDEVVDSAEEVDVSVVAAERDPWLGRLLRRRLAVRGLADGAATVHTTESAADGSGIGGDSSPVDAACADVLVTRMPYLSHEHRHRPDTAAGADPLAWVGQVTEGLTPGRTAVVCGPADVLLGTLDPRHPAERARRALLRDGRVESVVHLPGGLVPHRPAYQPGLWVLRRADEPRWRDRVLLADVSDRELSAPLVEDLVADVTTWRRDGYQPDQRRRVYASQVAVADLLAPRVPLTARRPPGAREAVAPEYTVARAFALETALAAPSEEDAALSAVHTALSVRDGGAAPLSPRSLLLLQREGMVRLLPGHRLVPDVVVPDGHHPVLGVPELTGAQPLGMRTVDRGVLAADYPRARFTQPGDVVVTLTPRLAVQLDRDGYAVVESPARVVRVCPAAGERLPPAVLAALLSTLPQAGHPADRAAGAVRPPSRLADLQVPVLPPAEARRLDALLATAAARRDRARREIDQLDELCRIATTGLAGGTLTMADAPRARPEREGGGA